MKLVFKAVACASLCVGLSGCYSFTGVPQLINAGGVVNEEGTGTERTQNLKANFRIAVNDAAEHRDDWGKVSVMMDTGYLLAFSNCDDFFRVMGFRQRDSEISRDLIAPIISILTGILAIRDFTNADRQQDYIEGIGIGSAAFVSAIDVHDRHFLFGAENIYEVEQLTLDALAASEEQIRRAGVTNFETAVQNLIRHQGVCTPASIKGLAKRAIAVGNVVPNTRFGMGLPDQDAAVLAALGESLGLPGTLSDEQAAAAWWLYAGSATKSEYETIKALLAETSAADKITVGQSPAYDRAGAPDENAIATELARLSPETRARYEAARDQFRSDTAEYQSQLQKLTGDELAALEEPEFEVTGAGGTANFRLDVQ